MKIIKDNVLAEGEATGHKHRVQVQVIERENGVREFSGATEVLHEEHETIVLPDQEWASDRVLEMDYVAGMENKVKD